MAPASRLRRLALQHWRANRLSDASRVLRAAIAHTPADAALWRDLAGIQQAAGNDPGALQSLDQSLVLDPANAATWLARATTATRIGDHAVAERAFARTLLIDPANPDSHLGRGFLCLEQNRLDDAIASFGAALAHAPAYNFARTCLAHALYAAGDFPAAAATFEALTDLDEAAQHKANAAFLLRALIQEGPHALDTAQDNALSARDASDLLSRFGHVDAAIALTRYLLARDPANPVLRYQLDALTGVSLDRSPPSYVEHHFDDMAASFDDRLGQLDYRVPERLTAQLAQHRSEFAAALDLGCGTGLAAPHLRSLCTNLTGIDLSPLMLERAAARCLYDGLDQADAIASLAARPAALDLVFAADLLIYLGDLAPLFAAAAAALRPGGLFAFSLESIPEGTFALQMTGRFAHALSYLEALATPSFTVLSTTSTILRLEGRHPVPGHLLIFRRT